MTRFCYALIGMLLLVACNEETPSANAEVSPDGVNYTLVHLPGHNLVSIQVAWATDWAYRTDVNQAAPYIGSELILAGGADGFAAGDVTERFADIDAVGYLNPTVDHVLGDLTFPKEHLTEALEIANAHLQAPSLDETWFTRIRDGLSQNMTEARTQPAHLGFDAVRWAVFGTQPVRNALSLDDPDMFDSITPDDVGAWHGETFSRNPSAIVIAGDLDSATAGQAIDALLSELPDKETNLAATVVPDFKPRRILLHIPEAQVTNLAFVAPFSATRLGGEWDDLIIAHALGGDDQSVLFEAVRTGLRASYGYAAGLNNYTREHRIMFMNGEIETEKLAQAEDIVLQAYAAFLESGPTGSLADRKSPLEVNLSTLPEYVTDQAASELQSQLDGFPAGRSLKLSEELAVVSEASIAERLASAFPAETDFIVIAVSADATALPGACVITTPEDAVNC